jgi:hypothetical protein
MVRRPIAAEEPESGKDDVRERRARDARERDENAPLSAMVMVRMSQRLAMWLTKESARRHVTPSALARRILREVMLADREK